MPGQTSVDPADQVRHYIKTALESVEQVRDYVNHNSFGTMRADAERKIATRPLTAVAIALGAGFLIGKILKD